MHLSTLTKRIVVLLLAVAATAPASLASGSRSSGTELSQRANVPTTQCPCNAGLPARPAAVEHVALISGTGYGPGGLVDLGDAGTRIQIPPSLANFREPGSTGYVPKATQVAPAWLESLHEPGSTGYVPKTTRVAIPSRLENFREPGSTGFVPTPAVMTVTSAAHSGFDWVSALIGAGAALGVAFAGGGAFMTVRKRRTLAHV
jgi:hypothetical protein